MIAIGIDPVLFSIGSFSVGWYGIMVALAVLTLVAWCLWWARKDPRISYNTVINISIVGIPSGIIFSRLLHVIDRWEYFWNNPGDIIGGSGLTIYGAVLGAALGVWIYSRISKISYGYLTDMLAPGIILAQAIGRVGCTILGDDTGLETSLPWGVVYTHPGSPTNQLVGLTATHPVVTYEIIFNLIVFGGLLLLRKKLRPDGSLFMVYLSLYAVWRLGGDFLREGTSFLFGLHQAQFIAIVVLAVTITIMALKTRWVRRDEISSEE